MKLVRVLEKLFIFFLSNRTFSINLLAIFLGIVASLTTFGFIINSVPTIKLGRATGFSPLPLPFRNMGGGRESMNFSYALYAKKENESWYEIKSAFENVPERPHRMGIPFEAVIGFRAEIPSPLLRTALLYECKFQDVDELRSVVSFKQGAPISVNVVCPK